jgi:hypothetical protein
VESSVKAGLPTHIPVEVGMICFAYNMLAPNANSEPTADELQQRRKFYKRIAELRSRPAEAPGAFQTIEEMIREDRDR